MISKFILEKLDGKFPKNLVLFGQSLGCAQAAYALENLRSNYDMKETNVKVIMLSPFTTIQELSKNTLD